MGNSKRRQSRQRSLILEELRNRHDHPTARDLFDSIGRRFNGLSLATVYRNLDILSEQGQICRFDFGDSARFDGFTFPHDHIRCVVCGRLDDIPVKNNVRRANPENIPEGYFYIGRRVDYQGICPACRLRA